MTQEQKDLLLKDLSTRVFYNPKFSFGYNVYTLNGIVERVNDEGDWVYCLNAKGIEPIEIELCKPYLFPISSMNEEQLEEFYCKFVENEIDFNDFKKYYFETNSYFKLLTSVSDCPFVIDWFNKNHLDYRGLISMGLAIDASNLNIY